MIEYSINKNIGDFRIIFCFRDDCKICRYILGSISGVLCLVFV